MYERQRAQSPFSPYANEMEMHAYVFVLRSRESKRVSVYANREDETSEKSVPNAHSNLRRELRASVKQVFFGSSHFLCVLSYDFLFMLVACTRAIIFCSKCSHTENRLGSADSQPILMDLERKN